jgi:beta-lactamase superfamily II metal-dependent hydrolase
MKLTIFDVEHGASALLSTTTGCHGLIDCGYNSTTGWRPSTALPAMGITNIDELFITNYDEDHVNDLPNLRRSTNIRILTRNPTVSSTQLPQLKSEDCQPGKGMRELIEMTSAFTHPIAVQPNWGEFTFDRYWNNYPTEFIDENNLSMALFVHHPQISLLFPGDLEKAGWKKLIQNPNFVASLRRVHVLVASHHGRENGCCEELFSMTSWKPQVVVISDDYKQYDTQETTNWYRARSFGIPFFGEKRHVFTTRRDGSIFIQANAAGASIDTSYRQTNSFVQALVGQR